jgi:putative oxidoreductase
MNRALGRLAAVTPVLVRLIVGGMMFVHGLDKLTSGPAGFGQFLEQLDVPAPALLAWLVTLLELVGGALLVVGFLSRLVALLMTIELAAAIALVTWPNGLIAAQGVGYERELAYIAGFITVLLLGPGRPSLDHALGLEEAVPRLAVGPGTKTSSARTAGSA